MSYLIVWLFPKPRNRVLALCLMPLPGMLGGIKQER